MRRPLMLTGAVTIALISMYSCKKSADATADTANSGTTTTTESDFETHTKDTTVSNAVTIVYDGTTATVTNPLSSGGVSVAVNNADVVVTSTTTTTEVNYVVSGKTTNGSLRIYSDYKFGLVLNGTGIINTDGPAVNIQSGKKVSVVLVGSTVNRLIDGATYATSTEDQKATFFSEGQLLFSGSGTLNVAGKYKHAICSDDYISVSGGTINVTAAASDGIHANDYFKMDGGTVSVTSSGDGIEAEEGYVQVSGGTVTVNSVDDGITASYEGTDATITPYIKITGGAINVTTTGEKGNAVKSESYTSVNGTSPIVLTVSGKGAKGIKTGGDLSITAGDITINTTGAAYYNTTDKDIAAPAGINCDGNFLLSNGTVMITSTGQGGKGITVDGTSTISGGTLNITASGAVYTYNSSTTSEAKGFKSDGAITISGGNISIAATDDGIKSETSVTINNGTVQVTKSTEGIEAPIITVADGTVNVVSSDDCLNATKGNGGESNDGSMLTIAGGKVYLSSTAGDAMDSNGSITMTGGTVVAQGPSSQPELAIDYNGTFLISGGLLIAAGPNSGNMIQATSSTSAQNTVLVKVSGNVAAGTLFGIKDASGNDIVTFAPARTAYYFVFSSSSLVTGASYKVYTGGTYSVSAANGLYSGGAYSGGTEKGSFTVSSKATTVSL